jgi:glycosyltransferase involved in cell wall biosynthesis
LITQTGIDYEIIVVDDDSTDCTAQIAQSFTTGHVGAALQARPRLTLIPAPPLSANWTGKNNAMAAGAKIAKGQWLLFTDADTMHKPGSLARAVAEAEEHKADLLSYSPEQEVRTFWEKAVMPLIFAELATTYPPQAVNDPASPIAAANGQYLMVSREAYDAVGGHEPVANNLLEDVAMARLIKSSGRKIFFRYGGDAVRTRMYRSWEQMKDGWTKNLALLFPHPVALALLRAAEFVLILANLVVAVWAGLSGRSNLALQATLLTIILTGWFWLRIRKAHFSLSSDIAAVIGLPLFSAFLFRSIRAYRLNAVWWKGREYGSRLATTVVQRSTHASSAEAGYHIPPGRT